MAGTYGYYRVLLRRVKVVHVLLYKSRITVNTVPCIASISFVRFHMLLKPFRDCNFSTGCIRKHMPSMASPKKTFVHFSSPRAILFNLITAPIYWVVGRLRFRCYRIIAFKQNAQEMLLPLCKQEHSPVSTILNVYQYKTRDFLLRSYVYTKCFPEVIAKLHRESFYHVAVGIQEQESTLKMNQCI